ncbi:hypothetical protein NYR58_18260 [Chelativorans intermedius]|nr:hypothetical protein [Chelativorans intermedius]
MLVLFGGALHATPVVDAPLRTDVVVQMSDAAIEIENHGVTEDSNGYSPQGEASCLGVDGCSLTYAPFGTVALLMFGKKQFNGDARFLLGAGPWPYFRPPIASLYM